LNTATSGPACSDDPLKHHIGVQYQPAAGVILEAAVVEDSKTVKNIQIAVCGFLFGVSYGYLTKFTVQDSFIEHWLFWLWANREVVYQNRSSKVGLSSG
jgi:hypothetical protein